MAKKNPKKELLPKKVKNTTLKPTDKNKTVVKKSVVLKKKVKDDVKPIVKSKKSVKPIKPKKKLKKKRAKLKPKKPIGFKNKRVFDPNRGLGLYTRIKSLLWREFKSNYSSSEYQSNQWVDNKEGSFITILNQVYLECKLTGEYCTDEVLIKKYLVIVSRIKRDEPFFPSELYSDVDGKEYWNIKDVAFDSIALVSPYLWVVSPMIIAEPAEFMIGDYVKSEYNPVSERYQLTKRSGYLVEFKDWIDWCNAQFRGLSYDDIPYFIFSKPEWNKKTFRWETELFITDKTGKVDSFGYVPEGGKPVEYLPKKKEVVPDVEEITEEPEAKPVPKEDNKELELEKQKEKTAKAETERMKTQLELIKEYKALGLSKDEIKKLLGL